MKNPASQKSKENNAAPQAVACSSRESIEEFSWFHMQLVQSTPKKTQEVETTKTLNLFFTVMHALQ